MIIKNFKNIILTEMVEQSKWPDIRGRVKIKSDWTVSKEWLTEAQRLVAEEKLKDVREGKDIIRQKDISRNFLENFDNNVAVIERRELQGYVDIDDTTVLKPMPLTSKIQEVFDKCEASKKPFTLAVICTELSIARENLSNLLEKQNYKIPKKLLKNLLLRYAEEKLFDWKNVAGVIYYLNNNFRDIYSSKPEGEGKQDQSISLSKLFDKSENLKRKLKNKTQQWDLEIEWEFDKEKLNLD